jgi:hypothetical protein
MVRPATSGATVLTAADHTEPAAWDGFFARTPILVGTMQRYGAGESIRCHPLVGASGQRSNQNCGKSGQ